MKNIVFALTSTSGGALTNLKELYNEALTSTQEWIFVVGSKVLTEQKNIKVLNYSKYRKNKFLVLFFIIFIYKKIMNKYKPDCVYNMQYFKPKFIKGINSVYFATNCLFFIEKRISIKDSLSLWLRLFFLKNLEFSCIKKSTTTYVECDWMKKIIVEKLNVDYEKVVVKKHSITVPKEMRFHQQDSLLFFYPSSALFYKNHKLIFDAFALLDKETTSSFSLALTLKGDENRQIKKCRKKLLNNIQILWMGTIDKELVYDTLSKSVLLFPSTIETIGLPLIEAKTIGCYILCADLPYAHEALGSYEKAYYFNPYDSYGLATLIKQFCLEKFNVV